MKRLVIIGGGIAGLAAAWRAQAGAPAVETELFEREPRLGGKIRTERFQDYVLDCGPDSFLSRKPAGVALCREIGLDRELVGQLPQTARSFVAHHHRLYPVPEGFSGLVPTNLDALLKCELFSERARHRILQERSIPPARAGKDETIAQFFSRRFGPELFELLIEPLLSGIYAGEGASLSLEATYPQLREMERRHGSVLAALERARPPEPAAAALERAHPPEPAAAAPSYPPFVSFRDGLETLVTALASRLDRVRLHAGSGAAAIERVGRRYRVTLESGERVDADAVVVATPAPESARLFERLDTELRDLHAAIPFASSVVIHLGFDARALARGFEGYGYVVPQVEGSDLLACSYSSNKWAGRAPADRVTIRLFAGRFGRDAVIDKSDDELVALARRELAQTLEVDSEPLFARLYRFRRAMPQYTLDHLARLRAIEERAAAHAGLGLAGASYRGVGIPDCIDSGDRAARAALSYLEGVGDEA